MTNKMLIVLMLMLISFNAHAKRLHHERWYQQKYCEGILEHVLSDKTRVDCLTDEYAIEYDFGNKWAEAIGQALYYARMTGRKPGVVLILEKQSDKKYLKRLKKAAPWVKIWVVRN